MTTAPTLTLQDIADLARVRRPVVSMWRTRPRVRGQLMPFPNPIDASNGVERFSRDDVVAWLQRTGRGNNSEAHLDAPALSAPDGVSLEELVTLLCLHATTGEELAETTAEQRAVLARAADPGDRFLLREITAAESIGIEGRGPFYEQAGALRDVVQNHVMELLSFVAMEPPVSFQADAVRAEKVKVLHALQPLVGQDVVTNIVRAQYGPGWVGGHQVPAYTEEAGVSPTSTTENFTWPFQARTWRAWRPRPRPSARLTLNCRSITGSGGRSSVPRDFGFRIWGNPLENFVLVTNLL